MKAVWSFWTKPFEAHRRFYWPSEKHHLFAWVLSVETTKWNPDRATQAGFTHPVAGAKQNQLFADRLENRVRRDYPKYYRRCVACCEISVFRRT